MWLLEVIRAQLSRRCRGEADLVEYDVLDDRATNRILAAELSLQNSATGHRSTLTAYRIAGDMQGLAPISLVAVPWAAVLSPRLVLIRTRSVGRSLRTSTFQQLPTTHGLVVSFFQQSIRASWTGLVAGRWAGAA